MLYDYCYYYAEFNMFTYSSGFSVSAPFIKMVSGFHIVY